ncbi:MULTISPECIES: hypothetical protein [Arthrobacter]|uniref:Relaxase/Mobilisation nuclease domain-containing protein n=2 Tax=Arthrobacter TaxID=1663 RepID=A0ABU9KIY2_9MICC|nr:hypothetical protein [Arthrobacter sp. YJM1]MDP5226906.1 hypothetical protein [Arthrobacter sp. YJM1]
MSATVKHIPTKSSPNLDDYLGREKEGNDLPRVLYEAGQHCRPETAKAEFRALREEHGQQGAMRTVAARYAEPDDPSDATHLKVGKNWRAAKPNETATHLRIEPQVPFEKRDEAHHFIYSFDLATVNPDDPDQCLRAFEAVVAFREQDTPGTQSKFVAHGDAKGSKAAIERGEGGKFHVHEAMNAVVHTDMVVEGREFKAGQRVAGAITHVDSYRARWDRFLETRGHEFGLAPQDRAVLPEVGSPEYRAKRTTDKDFWSRERGEISDHDRARRGIEAAFGELWEDRDSFALLAPEDRVARLAAVASTSGDVELKLRSTQKGDRIRSFVVPGRAQAIGSTKLGDRYSNIGIAEQLELLAQGDWKPLERRSVGPAKEVPELPDATIASLQERAELMALDEQQEAELDAWLADRAAEDGTTVEELWAARGMTGTERERHLAHGWKADWETAQAEREASAAALAEQAATQSLAPEAQKPFERRRFETTTADAAQAAPPSSAGTTATKPVPLRRERQVGVLRGEQMKDAELLAVVRAEREDGGAYVDFQLSAADPAAQGQRGLHLHASRQKRLRDGREVEGTRTVQQLTPSQYRELRQAAGDNAVEVEGREVLAVRGNVMPATRGGYTANTKSLGPSHRGPIGPDVLEKQRASEDLAREAEAPRASDKFAQAVSTSKSRGDGDRGLG